ncbi:MAG: hypothetical protein NTZ05_18000 [Chloroflexi bacterium]|nr:hypothetical protein [Chloroflexota bacterium]
MLLARSAQLAAMVSVPSPDDTLLVGQVPLSCPAPLSLRFHVTVTSPVFQPAALAYGLFVRLAAGAVVSPRMTTAFEAALAQPPTVCVAVRV